MTAERAQELLEAAEATGNFSRHMTPDELTLLDDIWARMQRSASYQEILELIAAGAIQ